MSVKEAVMDEAGALRAEVAALRTEVERLRAQKAGCLLHPKITGPAHIGDLPCTCDPPVPSSGFHVTTLPAAMNVCGGAAGVPQVITIQPGDGPLTFTRDIVNTGCAAGVPPTVMYAFPVAG